MKSKTISYGVGNLISDTFDIGGGYMTYKNSRKRGNSLPVALAKTATDMTIGALLPMGPQLLYQGITVGASIALQTSGMNAQLQDKMKNTGSGHVGSGHFDMSNAGYTMRQRAMNQIKSNGQNINGVLGNEARNYIKSAYQ